MQRSSYLSSSLALAGGAFLIWAFMHRATQGDAGDEMFAQLCVSPATAALVADEARADHVIRVDVPLVSPAAPGVGDQMLPPQYIRQNEVVEFRVESQRKGGLAVHGLSNLVKVEGGREAVVRFKAIYTGRFPLHFHGNDGSHFEIAVLEIRK